MNLTPGITKSSSLAKRAFDILLSSIGIVVSVPLWIIIGFLIWADDRGPVFYSQKRVGKNGKAFKARKFRSMIKNAEKKSGPVWAEENDPRITRVGRVLRATGLDEFPQLINILKGDMSIVGPRPERPEFVEQFSEEIPDYNLRHRVRPGLAGLAQVFGRHNTPPRWKLRYDLLYIRRQSFWLDIRLICLCFWITAKGKWESSSPKIRRRRSLRAKPNPSSARWKI